MRSKLLFKWSLIVITNLGVGLSSIIIFLSPDLPVHGSYTNLASPKNSHISQNPTGKKLVQSIQSMYPLGQLTQSFPIRIKIPKISVNAALEHVGLTPQGEVDVPKNPANAAWFVLGPLPGEDGSSIIDGHFGWVNGRPTVFNNLNKLQKGDKLYVEDDRGKNISFVVRELRTYSQNEDASDVFNSSDGKAHLNLITCKGRWDKAQNSYPLRLVVFSDKVSE